MLNKCTSRCCCVSTSVDCTHLAGHFVESRFRDYPRACLLSWGQTLALHVEGLGGCLLWNRSLGDRRILPSLGQFYGKFKMRDQKSDCPSGSFQVQIMFKTLMPDKQSALTRARVHGQRPRHPLSSRVLMAKCAHAPTCSSNR